MPDLVVRMPVEFAQGRFLSGKVESGRGVSAPGPLLNPLSLGEPRRFSHCTANLRFTNVSEASAPFPWMLSSGAGAALCVQMDAWTHDGLEAPNRRETRLVLESQTQHVISFLGARFRLKTETM